jgi:DNA-binding transcriptional regulator YiaG
MITKFRCPHCNKGYQLLVTQDYVVELPHGEKTIPRAEYFECNLCHELSLDEKLIRKINQIEQKEAEKILISVNEGKALDTKSVSFLRKVTGLRSIDLANKLKLAKSTISNWDKKNSELPYHLSLLLCSMFAHKLHFVKIEKEFRKNLDVMIAS